MRILVFCPTTRVLVSAGLLDEGELGSITRARANNAPRIGAANPRRISIASF
jgi:hypothetical protein